jgi:hypothetical protein
MPDIKLDFSRVTYSGVLDVVAPIVPGGILGLGTLILNPQGAAKLLSNEYLGYRSRLVLGVFAAYIAGLLLNLFVSYNSYFLGYMIGLLFGKELFKNSPTPWRNLLWRRVARRFLGPDLAPVTDDLYFKEMYEAEKQKAQQIQDPTAKATQLKFVEEFFLPKSIAEGDWYFWYDVLGKYFTAEQWWAPPWQYFLSMVHTASWAVIYLMVVNHRHHWFAWLLSINGIFFGNFVGWFSGGTFSDPFALTQTAMLLREMKPQVKDQPTQ